MNNGDGDGAPAVHRRHAELLFQCAYPSSQEQWEAANRELRALAVRVSSRPATALQNSGIAGTTLTASFSLATTRWLADRFPGAVELDSIDGDRGPAMALLGGALDPVESEVLTEQALGWAAWQRRHLGPGRPEQLRRLVALVDQLSGDAVHREAVFGALRAFVRWRIPVDAPVLTTGRFGGGPVHLHRGALRRRASLARAWRQGPARRVRLTPAGQQQLTDLARGTLASLLGETDPFTHPAVDEVECHDLGQGIEVALFPCAPAWKLPLEAYVGYLLLRNRVPVAYGGGWVLGRQARFGINVLPPFRGGGSAELLAQLLRLYAHRFGLKLFIVEPYQIGLGNPDGIRSGAFWFYWRPGFRPRQRALLALARAEQRRIAAGGPRSPASTLRRLSHSVMEWRTPLEARCVAVDIEAVGARVSRHILEQFDGDRAAATRSSRRALGLTDDRLATLLAAIAPPGGWSRRDVARLDRIMAGKDRDELNQAVRLGRQGWLMEALAAASSTEVAGR